MTLPSYLNEPPDEVSGGGRGRLDGTVTGGDSGSDSAGGAVRVNELLESSIFANSGRP